MKSEDGFQDCLIVMAHPDDEILWASSILKLASKVILCFGDSPNKPEVSAGRKSLLKDFPLQTVRHLGIAESGALSSDNWSEPKETPYGLKPSLAQSQYELNFHTIVDILRRELEHASVVVTHNPWGEYGHVEHVQIYRAVMEVQKQYKFRVYVTGYFSDRTARFMNQCIIRLGNATLPMHTNPQLGLELKTIYQQYNCWTWRNEYEWPEYEVFLPVLNSELPLVEEFWGVASTPLNFIFLGDLTPTSPQELRRNLNGLVLSLVPRSKRPALRNMYRRLKWCRRT